MKIYCPQLNRQVVGGGWTFLRNLQKALPGIEFTEDPKDVDLTLVSGATMVKEVSELPKPILLRVDGIPHDERNRGAGMNKLRHVADIANWIVYQSKFAKDRLEIHLGKRENSSIIYNGVDQDLFKSAEKIPQSFAYVSYRKDPAKRYEEAREIFTLYADKYPEANLSLIGRFSTDNINYGFGFYNGERVNYYGIVDHNQLASLLSKIEILLFPSYMDWCPNTVLEALASGCGVIYNSYGGVSEIVFQGANGFPIEDIYVKDGIYRLEEFREKLNPVVNKNWIDKNFSLKKMSRDYLNLITQISK